MTAMLRLICLAVLAASLVAADPATAVLDELRAANNARSALASESAAWTSERQRLEALIAATEAETARLTRAAAAVAARRDATRARLAALGSAGDITALRARLASAAATLTASLRALATTVPPGVVTLGEDAGFDAAVRALEQAERAAATVSVEVVSGRRDGSAVAVKLLRVAGAAAWWVALDGQSAGSAQMRDGVLELTPAADADAIRQALAQAEGRAAPGIVVLP